MVHAVKRTFYVTLATDIRNGESCTNKKKDLTYATATLVTFKVVFIFYKTQDHHKHTMKVT